MAFTKIAAAGIGSTGTVTLENLVVTGGITAALIGTATSTTNIPNLTGAITSNNTTTSLGSFTSAQLATALTDETGSGSAVFATSPTLITPALGIATAQSLVVSGISTLGITTTTNLTSQSLVVSGISTLGITTATNLTTQSLVVSGISTLGITTTTNLTAQSLVVSGISTLGTVVVGGGTTQLIVTGNARITGILTVGTGSITLNGSTNIINVGTGVTLSSSAINVTGIITATSIVVSAGTVSLPSISPSGDPNTGVFFPAADQVAVASSGSRRLLISNTQIQSDIPFTVAMGGVGYQTIFRNGANEDNFITHGASGFTQFRNHNGTEYMRLDSSGRFLIGMDTANANGGILQLKSGITFPATAVAASNANTLDDYEEGTWTATLGTWSGTAPTTTVTATGQYTKIGRLVHVEVQFSNVSTAGASGDVKISGIPFNGSTGNPANGTCAAYLFDFPSGLTNITFQVSDSNIAFYISGDNVTWANLIYSAGSGRYLSIAASYIV